MFLPVQRLSYTADTKRVKKALFSALAAAGLCIHSSVWAQPVAGASTAAAGMSAAGASGVTAAVTERVSRDSIPELLAGIWQGSDRLLFFGKDGSDFAAVLRVFYGWYADRAAEPASYAELSTRPRNDATATPAQHISLRYVTVAENASRTAGAYELEVQYPGLKEPVLVPVAVIDGKLYMDFLVRGSAQYTDSQNSLGNAPAAGSGSGGGVREIPSADGYWHAFFGVPGSQNDITVLGRSPLFNNLTEGKSPQLDYYINSRQYNMRYYLADDIYPKWATLVQAIPNPRNDAEKLFTLHQEAYRKDVERAFGILQARWKIISEPARGWSRENLNSIMMSCIILHNMIVEDERDGYIDGESDDDQEDPNRSRRARAKIYDGPNLPFNPRTGSISINEYMRSYRMIRSYAINK